MDCDMEVARRKVVDAKGDVIDPVGCLHRDTFDSYAGIPQSVHLSWLTYANA